MSRNLDVDLNEDVTGYEPSSDSDSEYDDNQKLLLEKTFNDDSNEDSEEEEEEVLRVYSSEEESDNRNGSHASDDDIESDDKLPDAKAWGKHKTSYYEGSSRNRDLPNEEDILREEREAKKYQNQLAEMLEDVDLTIGTQSQNNESDDNKDSEDETDDIFEIDTSKLTQVEKFNLFKKQSPEFFGLIGDYKERCKFAMDYLIPVLGYVQIHNGNIDESLITFVKAKLKLILLFLTNFTYYIHLKRKSEKVIDHPVMNRLYVIKQLLTKSDEKEFPTFHEQLYQIIEIINAGKSEELADKLNYSSTDCSNNMPKKRKKLKLLSENELPSPKKLKTPDSGKEKSIIEFNGQLNSDSDSENVNSIIAQDSNNSIEEDDKLKRPINYSIAKNKGLTSYRKKELRNPRVHNRKKYRKALIRRKGQVRSVLNEQKKYGGEIFGIKASTVKSRKFR